MMMKKFSINILSILLIWGIFQSCDKIDAPYLVKQECDNPNPQQATRKVVLEEFTGHTCVNCPTASAVAHNLANIYEDQLVLISVHAGAYSEPESGDFSYDFRTSTGNELDQNEPKKIKKCNVLQHRNDYRICIGYNYCFSDYLLLR